MGTNNINTNTTTHNAGFPPAPPETRQQAGVVKQKKPRLNVSNEVKALNGTRGRGSYYVRVKHDREWNEIRVILTDGTCKRAEAFVDLGHTAESKADALSEVRGTVVRVIEL